MSKSIISLPPVLQAVWTAAYAASLQGQYSWIARPDALSMSSVAECANEADEHAWEAVRRANGGELPRTVDP